MICLDPDKTVEDRFRSQFSYPSFRFINVDVMSYLELIAGKLDPMADARKPIQFDFIEDAHREFFHS